jgi:hypothetical protein
MNTLAYPCTIRQINTAAVWAIWPGGHGQIGRFETTIFCPADDGPKKFIVGGGGLFL